MKGSKGSVSPLRGFRSAGVRLGESLHGRGRQGGRLAAARGPFCRRPPGRNRASRGAAGAPSRRRAGPLLPPCAWEEACREGGPGFASPQRRNAARRRPRARWGKVLDAFRIVARRDLDRRGCALLPLSAAFSRARMGTSEGRVSAATPAPPRKRRAFSEVYDGDASADGAGAGWAEKGPRHARGLGGKEAEIVSLLLHPDVRTRGRARPERARAAADLAAQLRPDGSSRAKKSRAAAAGSPESASAPSSGSQSSGRCSR